jgi:hypothetical protein
MARGRDVVVTGLHRSGTTFVGHVLAGAGLFEIFEPFNKQFGSVLVDRWKPHPETPTRDGVPYRRVLERVLVERIRYRAALQTRNPLQRWVGELLGMHRQALRYHRACLANALRPRRRLFKDPDMLFCADELQRRHDCDVVILVRHPCAFYASVRRLGWRPPLGDLVDQPALVRDHLAGYAEHLEVRQRSFAEEAAILWLFAYTTVRDMLRANPALIVLRHEDVATQPLETFSRLFERLELPFGDRVQERIRRSTEGSRVRARDNRPHDLVRDARALAASWTRDLDAAEIKVIRDIVAPVYGDFYAEWMPESELADAPGREEGAD